VEKKKGCKQSIGLLSGRSLSRLILFSSYGQRDRVQQSNVIKSVRYLSLLPVAIKQVGNKFRKLLADGGYDSKNAYRDLPAHVEVLIPPRKNAIKENTTHQRSQ
jgi:hypothetical protein